MNNFSFGVFVTDTPFFILEIYILSFKSKIFVEGKIL